MLRPAPSEHAPFYTGYVAAVPDGDLLATMVDEPDALRALLAGADPAHAYAPGKWTVRQVLQHMIDTERVFAFRTLAFARGDQTPLPGFDENAYADATADSTRTLGNGLAEFEAVRTSTLALLRSLPEEAWSRSGTASRHAMSVRAAAWVMAGHARHHRAILQERYGLDAS